MKVAETIAVTVLDQVLKRHPDLKTGATSSDTLLKWLPLIVAFGTAFWTIAIASKQVEENTNDIAKLETQYELVDSRWQSVDTRLARIETTLEIVTGGRKSGGSR